MKTALERFEDKFIPEPNSGCWIWLACFSKKTGYGRLGWNGSVTSAHQVSYQLHKGRIPQGLEIDHLCRNRICVNPEHLEAVTHQVNMLRGATVVAAHVAKTNCPKGHPYSAENTEYFRNMRYCKECRRVRQRLAYRRRK
jgi:hypothetical protein